MSRKAAAAWVSAHPPAGLAATEKYPATVGATPVRAVLGYRFSEPDTNAWVDAGVDVTISEIDGRTSAWRVEGTAIWLDPTPGTDEEKGPRLRVTVAGGCPRSALNVVGVSNPATDLGHALLPPESAIKALICTYSGTQGRPPFTLTSRRPVSAVAAEQLAEMARRVPLARDTGGVIQSCAAGDGSTAVIAFGYAGRPDVDLWLDLQPCLVVGNGQVRVWSAAATTRSIIAIFALESAALGARR